MGVCGCRAGGLRGCPRGLGGVLKDVFSKKKEKKAKKVYESRM